VAFAFLPVITVVTLVMQLAMKTNPMPLMWKHQRETVAITQTLQIRLVLEQAQVEVEGDPEVIVAAVPSHHLFPRLFL
jgi:hypothetical protein